MVVVEALDKAWMNETGKWENLCYTDQFHFGRIISETVCAQMTLAFLRIDPVAYFRFVLVGMRKR